MKRLCLLSLIVLLGVTGSAQTKRRPCRPVQAMEGQQAFAVPAMLGQAPCLPALGLPSLPSPANNATSVATNATLSWLLVTGATSYDVAFGTTNPPPFVENVPTASYNPGALINGQVYYWNVTPHNNTVSRQGPTWTFTTIVGVPGVPLLLAPGDGATNISLTPTLQWSSLGATSYTVKFGTTNPPPTVVASQTGTTYTPSTLLNSTLYYEQIIGTNGAGSTPSAVISWTTLPTGGGGGGGGSSFNWSTNATWIGAFRLPVCTTATCGSLVGANFSFAGKGAGFSADHNSLYVSGSSGPTGGPTTPMLTAEVSIPSPLGTGTSGTAYTSWPFATVLQAFKDPAEGGAAAIGTECNTKAIIGDYLVYGGLLYFTEYCFYDASSAQTVSHFSRPLSLSTTGSVVGPGGFIFPLSASGTTGSAMHDYDRWINGYLALVPTSWQTPFHGNIISGPLMDNISGGTSQGPAALAWNTSTFSAGAGANAAQPLVYYTLLHPIVGGGYRPCSTTRQNCPPPVAGQVNYASPLGDPSTVWNSKTRHVGAIFVDGTDTFLVFEIVGTGNECYGNGVPNTGSASDPFPPDNTTVGYCYDPAGSAKGAHAYPYRFQVKAYRAADLLATVAGGLPWTPQPVSTTVITLPFTTATAGVAGIGYDPAGQRVFIVQSQTAAANGNRPFVHVYKLTVP